MGDGIAVQDDFTTERWAAVLEAGAFEETMAALEAVVSCLERGQLPLAETIGCYELGVRLAGRCERLLNEAELRVSQIDVSVPGEDMVDPDNVPLF